MECIISRRVELALFPSIDGLTAVEGIGEATLNGIRERITVR